jgi:hypothetical protein
MSVERIAYYADQDKEEHCAVPCSKTLAVMDTVNTDLCDLFVTLSSNKVISSLLLWTSLKPFIFLRLHVKDDKLIKERKKNDRNKMKRIKNVCVERGVE